MWQEDVNTANRGIKLGLSWLGLLMMAHRAGAVLFAALLIAFATAMCSVVGAELKKEKDMYS